jgi:hypothetical protein
MEREREREGEDGEDGGGGEKRGYLVWACDDILMSTRLLPENRMT